MTNVLPRWFMAIAATFLLTHACIGAPPVSLAGETIFTIPWGEGRGKLTFVPETQLSEGMYYGPTAMNVGPDGSIYLYDPIQRQLHRFLAHGQFDTGTRVDPNFGGVGMIVIESTRPGVNPSVVIANEAGNIARLDPFGPKAGPTGHTPILKGAINAGASLSRLGMATPGPTFLEVAGTFETAYIQCYEGNSYLRKFNATDLVSLFPRYYGLALDRHGKDLFVNSEGQHMVQEIDGYEAQVSREIPLTLPQIPERKSRWRLFGAGARGVDVVLYFAPHWPLQSNDPIYAVSASGNIVGTVRASLPDGKEPGRYLRLWNHLAAVDFSGNLYLAIPSENGLAIVRVKMPVAGP